MKSAAAAFSDVADGCAEVITEATVAFLGTGAGDAWRAIAQQRLRELWERLAEAKATAEYWPLAAAQMLRPTGRLHMARRRLQQEAAFGSAEETLDICCLLCELAARPHGAEAGLEADLVRSAAEPAIMRVADGAAALLRDFGRTNFQQAGLQTTGAGWAANDAHRKRLREAAETALRNSSAAAQELLLLKQFQSRSDASKLERGETFASARSEMASFLFLVHGLAADLLKREGSITQRAETLQEISMMPRASRARSLSAELTEDFLTSSLWVESKALQEPLLSPEQQRWRKNWGYRERTYQAVSSAVRLRWRSALKVSLSYFLALILDLHYGLDSVLVCTVSYLSSYGSQYAGGSLRRAISRGVGVAAGATVGSVLQHLSISVAVSKLTQLWLLAPLAIHLLVALCFIWCWTFCCMLVYFRKGPYAYVGFVAAFTAIKFLSCLPGESLHLTTTVASTMYACLLAVMVETCVLPIDARDLMQARVASSLVGVGVVLPALVTADEARTTLVKQTIDNEGLPDLTERLKEVGAYERYLEWREGYMRWRQGLHSGAKGEVSKKIEEATPTSAPKRVVTSFRPRDQPALPSDLHPSAVDLTASINSQIDGIQLTVEPSARDLHSVENVQNVHVRAVAEMPGLAELLAKAKGDDDASREQREREEADLEDGLPLPKRLPSSDDEQRISLTAVQEVLVEIREALAPAEELVVQAAERLDGLRINSSAWCSLADRLAIMRLWLSFLGRIAKRLGHGCFLTELLGGGDAVPAAEGLISAFCATIAASARAVAGKAPRPRECTKLEAQLRNSRQNLLSALWHRPVCRHEGRADVAAEVLALSAAHSVVALLTNAAKSLALSVEIALVQDPDPGPSEMGEMVETNEAAQLPDLTERLKEQGQYEKYIKWREGYMQWRSGGLSGSKGEVVENSTT